MPRRAYSKYMEKKEKKIMIEPINEARMEEWSLLDLPNSKRENDEVQKWVKEMPCTWL
jgi:hypothetical protein